MEKPKILFLGRSVHSKTGSDLFFCDLLREIADVYILRREEHSNRMCCKLIKNYCPDSIVFYQLPPSLRWHLFPFHSKRLFWVPMWDGFQEPSWKESWAYQYTGLSVISFCKKMHNLLEEKGLSSYFCQYFPEDKAVSCTKAPPYTIFFWQRDPRIALEWTARWFPASQIKKVIVKQDQQGKSVFSYPFPVEPLTGWVDKQVLLQKLQEADYYIAPRFAEGIGFGFLEAMALGKVVLAYNEATMNEYIEDGVTGHLFDQRGVIHSDIVSPSAALPNIRKTLESGRARWLEQRRFIQQLFL